MKIGDAVEVRNVGTNPLSPGVWARGAIVRTHLDGTFRVHVDHPSHLLHERNLTVDEEHVRPATS